MYTASNPSHSHQQVQIRKIEEICATDVGRGIGPLASATSGNLYAAAKSICDCPTPNVVITTGFFIPNSSPPAPETDGICGSVHLAAGLINAGLSASILTDSPCLAAIQAASSVLDLSIPIFVCDPHTAGLAKVRTEITELNPSVSHLVAIERLGPNHTGRLLGQYGFDFSTFMAPFHLLFSGPSKIPSCSTIGVGDGGNEIGMGKLNKELVEKTIERGVEIHCITPTEHLIVCGVSNWGGPAILCSLAILMPALRNKLLRFLVPKTDYLMLYKCVHEGPAVDGYPETIQMTVDSLPWEFHWEIISNMKSKILQG